MMNKINLQKAIYFSLTFVVLTNLSVGFVSSAFSEEMDYPQFVQYCKDSLPVFEDVLIPEERIICNLIEMGITETQWVWINGTTLDWNNWIQKEAEEFVSGNRLFEEQGIKESLVIDAWVSGRDSLPPPMGATIFFAYYDDNPFVKHYEKKFRLHTTEGLIEEKILPPLKQTGLFSQPLKIACNEGKYLLQKSDWPFEPACVNYQSVGKLINRGWVPSERLWNAITSYVSPAAPPMKINEYAKFQIKTIQEASEVVGYDILVPSYLPPGYKIQMINTEDDRATLFASKKPITNETTIHDFLWKNNGIFIHETIFNKNYDWLEREQKRAPENNAKQFNVNELTAFVNSGNIGYGKGGELRPHISEFEMLDGNVLVQFNANLPDWHLVTIARSMYHEKADVIIPHGSAQPEHKMPLVPKEITVVLGKNSTVTWRNLDDVASTLVADHGEFGTSLMLPGQASSITFNQTGTFGYHGSPHPWKTGKVIVLSNVTKSDEKLTQEPQAKQNFSLTVSNQSFDNDSVDITVMIDNNTVISRVFDVGGQHNFYHYDFSLEAGPHIITAKSVLGNAEFTQEFVIEDDFWGYLSYWYDIDDENTPLFYFELSKTRMGFM